VKTEVSKCRKTAASKPKVTNGNQVLRLEATGDKVAMADGPVRAPSPSPKPAF
jgi:hypothetical protein